MYVYIYMFFINPLYIPYPLKRAGFLASYLLASIFLRILLAHGLQVVSRCILV